MAWLYFAKILQKFSRHHHSPKENGGEGSGLQLIFEELLQKFCRNHQLPEESFGADNCFQLKVDGYLPVLLHADVDNARLSFYGPIPSRISGKISPAVIDMIKTQVLATNSNIGMRNNGPDIVPQMPWIFGYQHLPIAGLHVAVLEKEIDQFVIWLRQYK